MQCYRNTKIVLGVQYKILHLWGFPGSPEAKTLCFHSRDAGSIPDLGTEIPQPVWCSQ